MAALKSAEQGWIGGGAVQIVIQALNTLAAVAAVIPFTAVYSPLIDILVAGIDAVLEALPASTSVPYKGPEITGTTYDHHGRVSIHNFFGQPSTRVYKDKWNKVVASNPALAAARL